jgi:hypothetical protein
LASRENIPEEGSSYDNEVDDNTNVPYFRIDIRTIVDTTTDVKIKKNKEERRSSRVD